MINYTFEITDADGNVIDHETIQADTLEQAEHELELTPRPESHARYELEEVTP